MSDDLYLIAHKVRGEPAFDVAEQMTCPVCTHGDIPTAGCHECDSLGYWWIIPTSGHRAYPYWSAPLHDIDDQYNLDLEYWRDLGQGDTGFWPGPMPASLPDHYRTRAEPKLDLTSILGLIHAPLAPIKRRF